MTTRSERDSTFDSQLFGLRLKHKTDQVWLEASHSPKDDELRFIAPEGAGEKNRILKDKRTNTETIARGTQWYLTQALAAIASQLNSSDHKGPINVTMFRRHEVESKSFIEGTADVNLQNVPVGPVGNTFDKPSFGARKPGAPIYGHKVLRSKQYISFILENRGANGHFSDSEKGDLVDLCFDLLTYIQPHRTFMYAGLTDTRGFVFFKVTRTAGGDDFDVLESSRFEEMAGEKKWQSIWQSVWQSIKQSVCAVQCSAVQLLYDTIIKIFRNY